ncbi:MAG TPA: hypothetical protein VFA64_19005, partial [Hyphomicrobiaceae bacterium]|nr:hypothetical protein [Hyphomicrobiaceae bacterium]
WTATHECTNVTGKSAREFCQQFHKLNAEHASAQQSLKLEERISEIGAKLAMSAGATAMSEADPQASVLARISGLDVPQVQTALTIFVALLIEIGSGLGMYVAFAYWGIHERKSAPAPQQAASSARAVETASAAAEPSIASPVAEEQPSSETEEGEEDVAAAGGPPPARRLGANDNRIARGVPDSDVQRFYRERVVAAAENASLTSTELYEEYCRWCEDNDKVPFAHPRVTREIGELGVKKERIGKRTRYFGIALRAGAAGEEDKKLPTPLPRAA